jgi:hypothetical protein
LAAVGMARGEAVGAWAPRHVGFPMSPATPPDLEESGAHGILPGPLEDAAAALHPGKNHGIRIAGVIPDAGVGSLIARQRATDRRRYI